MRNISDNGLHFTAAWEQFAGTAYRATPAEKYLTYGYGHYGPDVQPYQKITEGQALLLLNRDMASAVAAVNAVAAPNLTQAQLDAVYDLVFNAGAGVISAATGAGQALREGDVTALRYKLGRFIFQGGKIMLGLRRRAAGRQALFDGKSWQEAEAIGRAVK
ncbi:putative baseplate central spike complex protein [Serratia phage vB_SmaM-Otaku]|uniref:Lysozyme n=1 Tax=Serratia phage vB_SmaM-Otaku TaxID=2932867 RepID=A0AAE9HE70_9CAUD|nr:putative baseplate central spike complex protein [Serratia phage vB_SmaM-Otaku]UPU16023.1 putative baseplate central spike complex protein [Serratia phage vB_SmaM-Otaku]